jgi:tRNA(fMet)-specific endonuclease VapC
MILLDTDVLTLVQRASSEEYEHIATRLDTLGEEPVCVPIVGFEEQARGWLAWIARARSLEQQIDGYARLRTLLEDYQTRPILDFDEPAATEYRRLAKLRVKVGTMDLKIAAIAIANDALLISRNLKDFRKIPGLDVEDWTRMDPI